MASYLKIAGFIVVGAVLLLLRDAASSSAQAPGGDAAPGRYIVVLADGVDAPSFARGQALRPQRSYSRVFPGFAADLQPDQVRRLRADGRVRGITRERTFQATAFTASPALSGATLPTGVDRIDAEYAPIVEDVGVAVLDSGIDLGRPEFNLAGALSFVPAVPSGQDDFGHGTHVAGTATATVMPGGFRGVAPRAPLWSMKVLDSTGNGDEGALIAAVDWLTANGPGRGIRVANMSFGGQGTDDGNCGVVNAAVVDAFHYAICQSVQAGIMYTASAGNGGNAAGLLPAAYSEVIAVSNVQDNDGKGGAFAPPNDDRFYATSSYGSVVDIAAPGTAILSTVPTGSCLACDASGYRLLTGTSMSAPHVAGALVDYVARNPGASTAGSPGVLAPAAQALIAAAKPQTSACGFSGDPDAFAEPMVYVGAPPSECGSLATPDADGDGLPDSVETSIYGSNPGLADTDGDGCTDGMEAGADQLRGGRRDPTNGYDFADVPTPVGPAVGADGKLILGAGATRNRAVLLADVSAALAYTGRTSSNPAYQQDNNGDGIPDGQQFDRTPSLVKTRLWQSRAPNGVVTLSDVSVILAQVGTTCIP